MIPRVLLDLAAAGPANVGLLAGRTGIAPTRSATTTASRRTTGKQLPDDEPIMTTARKLPRGGLRPGSFLNGYGKS
jgi:hypothetical protein